MVAPHRAGNGASGAVPSKMPSTKSPRGRPEPTAMPSKGVFTNRPGNSHASPPKWGHKKKPR